MAIPLDEYESMKETLELLSSNPRLADELKKEREKMNKGQSISLSDFKRKYEIK